MSEILPARFKLAVAIGASLIIGNLVSVAMWKFIKRKLSNVPPKKWRKVGELSDLLCYPIKSCGWIRIDELDCNKIGVQQNFMRDRTFMIVTSEGEFVTARKYPKLVLAMPEVEGDLLKLTAPGMNSIEVYFHEMLNREQTTAIVWDERVKVYDAGDDVARWFSRFILQQDSGLRMVFYPLLKPTRDVRQKNKIFDTATREDTGALHDASSYMLINENSVGELNTRLEKNVSPLQFRPNFVVRGASVFDEDKWKWVKIGDEVIFKIVKPCTRCVFTNIDPHTGERDQNDEPLKTLKSYRQFDKTGESPVMGIHIGIRKEGKIRINDSVYVEDD